MFGSRPFAIAIPAKYSCRMSNIFVVALTIACLFGLWTAVACRRAQYRGLPGSDALIWAGSSGALFLLSLIKTARGLGVLRGFGGVCTTFQGKGLVRRMRKLADGGKHRVLVIALFVCGLRWAWHYVNVLSPRHALYGPYFGLRDHSLHFSA